MSLQTIIERDGKAWEHTVKVWLRLRYPGCFVETPAEHHGDFGVEGFSRDGIAYQCYATREPLRAAELYENQRIKITTDIGKFIDKKKELSALFGPLKIKAWWLVVTEHKSSKTIQHATLKTQEVLNACLPYTTSDFVIHIAPGYEEFAVEQRTALRQGIEQLRLPPTDVKQQEVSDWAGENDGLVNVLEQKLSRLVGTPQPSELKPVRDEAIKHFRAGANLLDRIRSRSAEIWEAIESAKNQRQRSLRLRSGINPMKPSEFFDTELKELQKHITLAAPNLHADNVEEIALGIVTDWLLECSLNFREVGRADA